ncbi:MAG: DUF4202 domain-containing protein [Actinomycetota bacterium]|nr:DUF4202 domain-containing protein [Actinomycetota bacterium]
MDQERLRKAIDAIDATNAADPNRILVEGEERPKELAHAELVTEWVRRLRPEAGEPLLLAARAHHLRRWAVPRSTYPEGRAGYLRWRRDLHERHAAETAEILRDAGYDEATVARVGDIVRKRNLKSDPDVQALEDALCLVFLQTQFHDLADRLEHAKTVEVVRKTLAKMSDDGKRYALGIPQQAEDAALLEEALAG